MAKRYSLRKFFLFFTIISFSLFACISRFEKPILPAPQLSKKIFITDIQLKSEENKTILTFYSNEIFDFTSFTQKNPPAIILEIPNGYIHKNLQPLIFSPDGPVQEVIPEQISYEDKFDACFIIKMKEIFPYEIKEEDNKLKIDIIHENFKTSIKYSGKDSENFIEDNTPPSPEASKQAVLSQKIPQRASSEDNLKPLQNIPKKEILRIAPSTEKSEIQRELSQKEKPENSLESFLNDKQKEVLNKKNKYMGKPISLDFQNADIQSVLRIIADVSSYNLVIDPKVEGKVNISLIKPVPWDQALDVILKSNKLDMKIEGNIIRVSHPETFKNERETELNNIETERKAREEERKSKPLITKIVNINYAKAEVLIDKIKPMLSTDTGLVEPPSIVVDERTNTLIVKDLPEVLDNILDLIKTLDRPTPQVMIEARIIETTKNLLKDLGIQWGGTYSKQTNYRFANTLEIKGATNTFTGVPVDSPTGRADKYAVDIPISSSPFGAIGINLGHINGSTSLDIQLKAMERSGKIRLVSNPRIATLDNEEASIKSGTRIPYQTTDDEGNPSTNFVDAMIDLTVTPQITPDNTITMKIIAAKSEPDWSNAVLGAPAISTRTAKTSLIVKDGDTAVIGGLNIQNNSQQIRKVPILGNIPVLGNMFKARDSNENFDEILIFITPRIIRDLDGAAKKSKDKHSQS